MNRDRGEPEPVGLVSAGGTRITLQFTPPFDAAAALGHLRAHAIPGSERIGADSVRRIVHAPSGPIAVTVTLTSRAVTAELATAEPAIAEPGGGDAQADLQFVAALVRRWFDLDLNPGDVSATLGEDPIIGPLLAARPGLRVIGSPHGFETAIMTVLGQQVSLASVRTFGGRLVSTFGIPGPAGLMLFPSAEAIAAADLEHLRAAVGLTGARARTVQALAAACASGMPLTAGADPTEFRASLLALPGIGPWTADYLAVRVLGDRDAFTAGDLVLRRALGGVSVKAAQAASEAWRPFRAYALFQLWTSTAY